MEEKITSIIISVLHPIWLIITAYAAILFGRSFMMKLPVALNYLGFAFYIAAGLMFRYVPIGYKKAAINQIWLFFLPFFLNVMRLIWFEQIFDFTGQLNADYDAIVIKSTAIVMSALCIILWLVSSWTATHFPKEKNEALGILLIRFSIGLTIIAITFWTGYKVYSHLKTASDQKNAEYANTRLAKLQEEKGFKDINATTECLYTDVYAAAVISDYLCNEEDKITKDMLQETLLFKLNEEILAQQIEKNQKFFEKYELPEDGIEYKTFQMKADRHKKTVTASIVIALNEKESGKSKTGCFYVTLSESWDVINMGFKKKTLIPIKDYTDYENLIHK